MKRHLLCITFLIFANQSFSSTYSIQEICDVEGSGMEDCPTNKYCCEQSICDKVYGLNNYQNTFIDIEYDDTQRCCTKFERKIYPNPSHCQVCTECCSEIERKKIPIPGHCSKCRTCNYLTTTNVNVNHGEFIIFLSL